MKKIIKLLKILTICIVSSLFILPNLAFAHPGSLDENGGHYDHSTGEYHYHHGYPAHEHYDIDGDGIVDCPYNFDDRTGENSGPSSASRENDNGRTYTTVIKNSEPKDKPSFWKDLLIIYISLFYITIPLTFLGVKWLVTLPTRIKKKRILEQERIKAQEEFNKQKEEFINSLNGTGIREKAGVPNNIKFENGLPIDNNDRAFGTFTVYISNNGKCFHQKRGCCSANKPAHYFRIKKHYRPCSKCCNKDYSIPQWYKNYMSLKRKAKLYDITIEE